MAQVKRSLLIEYSCEQMFDLVDDVEKYPEFLPWCSHTKVEQKTDTLTEGALGINFHGVRSAFSTSNVKQRPSEIQLRLKQGPFRDLSGFWRFKPLSDSACKIEFELNYNFSSVLLEKVFGPVFNKIAESFVEAFIVRAEVVYGKPK